MSKAASSRKQSQETIQKRSNAVRAKKLDPSYQRPKISQELRDQISAKLKGRKLSPETLAKRKSTVEKKKLEKLSQKFSED
jgi:hypothetical protein